MGYLLFFGSLGAVAVISWWLKRWQDPIDEYEQREYQDPPIFDAGGFLGGGPGGWGS
jgi:hypothetical protein